MKTRLPIYLLLSFVVSFCTINNSIASINCYGKSLMMMDSTLLVEFYESTGGEDWNIAWDLTEPIANWHGVSLDFNGQVVRLELQNNNLVGSLPLSLGSLTFLEILDLSNNGITGEIPASLANLSNLTVLNVAVNLLEGEIPDFIGSMLSLNQLDLDFNNLIGEIPENLGNLTNLTSLGLSHNELTGTIPASLGQLVLLDYFFLNSNNLAGSIPSSLGNLVGPIDFRLSDNQLTGIIPATLSNITLLGLGDGMDLSNNKLSGCFPDELIVFCGVSPTLNCLFNNNLPNGGDFQAFCDNNDAGLCIEGDVWPGDLNNDGIANQVDLLFFGLAFGQTGDERPNANTLWEGQPLVVDWENETYGINNKYQDANGDGEVNDLDYDVLLEKVENFPLTHDTLVSNSVVNNFNFRLDSLESNGSSYTIDVLPINAIVSTHGVACTVNLGNLSPESISVNFTNSIFNSDKHLYIYDDVTNQLHFSITKTDQQNLTILDDQLIAEIIIEDQIAALQELIDTTNQLAATKAMGLSVFATVVIDTTTVFTNEFLIDTQFSIFPNPSYGYLSIQSNTTEMKDVEINIYTSEGQQVFSEIKNAFEFHDEIDIRAIKEGIYILHLKTEDRVETHKIILL